MCGAVSGAIMAINLFYGRSLPDTPVEESYSVVQRFTKMFKKKHGSTNCEQLIGCDLGTEEGQKTFKENNLREQCQNYTEEATRMAMSIIQEES